VSFKLAEIDDQRNLTVNTWPVAVILAIITILPALVDTLVGRFVMTKAETASAQVEAGTLEVARQQAAAAILQAALADPDSIKRDQLLELLVIGHVVDSALKDLTPEKIPQWPALAGKSP
jgi:hypothetical protein